MRHMELSGPVRASLDNARVCWLATASHDGEPCLAPKTVFTAHGNTILMADAEGSECIACVRANPRVCISFLDVMRDAGFKVYAMARVVEPDDDDYPALSAVLTATRQPDVPLGAIVEAVAQSHAAVPLPVLQLHPHRKRGEMLEEHFSGTYKATP